MLHSREHVINKKLKKKNQILSLSKYPHLFHLLDCDQLEHQLPYNLNIEHEKNLITPLRLN